MSAATVVLLLVVVAPFVALVALCRADPAHLWETWRRETGR